MLEDYAIQYISLDEGSLQALVYGLFVFGAILAGITWRSKSTLSRAPYFAYSAAIYLAFCAVQLLWLHSFPAIVHGFAWLIVGANIVSAAAAGFGLCIIAMARSRDAYGHSRLAALAFIPLANLWLLFARPKRDIESTRVPTPALVNGGVGVLVGVLMFVAGTALQTLVTVQLQETAENLSENEDAMAAGNSMVIRRLGLEAAIVQLASEFQEPVRVDEITTLVAIEADGETLRYMYFVETDETTLNETFIDGLQQHFCTYTPLTPVIRSGGTIAANYYNSDRTLIGEVASDASVCGFS